MPETYTTEINAEKLAIGDVVVGDGGATLSVDGRPTVGTKYVTVPNTGCGKVRFSLGEQVMVRRSRLTVEEKAAANRRNRLEGMDWQERMDKAQLAAVRARIVQAIQGGHLPGYSDLEALASVQARVEQWNIVAARHYRLTLDRLPDEGSYGPEGIGAFHDRFEAARAVATTAARRAMDAVRYGIGRSTSDASNMLEAHGMSGMAQWAQDLLDSLEHIA